MSFQPKLNILFTQKEIEDTVNRLGLRIGQDYTGKNPLLVCVLKGAFMFMADLLRRLDIPLTVDFIRLSSYSRRRETSGKVKVVQGLLSPVRDRDVLVVEDIVDTGITAAFLLDYLRKHKPASLKLCALTDRPSRRQVPVSIDYLGFSVPDKFIVGYGLDWDEKYRNLPSIYVLEE